METEEIFEFIELCEGDLVGQVFNDSVVDVFLCEEKYIVGVMDKYVDMLENDKVDESFEEHVSKVMLPYLCSVSDFYEGMIQEAKAAKGKGEVNKDANFLKTMRKKYSAKSLGSSIKAGYGKAVAAGKKADQMRAGFASGLASLKGVKP